MYRIRRIVYRRTVSDVLYQECRFAACVLTFCHTQVTFYEVFVSQVGILRHVFEGHFSKKQMFPRWRNRAQPTPTVAPYQERHFTTCYFSFLYFQCVIVRRVFAML